MGWKWDRRINNRDIPYYVNLRRVKELKKIITVFFFLLMIALVSCKNNISDTENMPISTSDNYKQIEKKYMDKVMKVAEGDVVKSYIEDFEMNGEKSGFVLTEKKITEMESKFSLWFVSNDKVKILKKDVVAVNNSTIELIKNRDSVHVMFREVQFTLNDKFVATIYGVYNGKAQILFSKKNIRIDIDNNKIYGTERQTCYYDYSTKINMVTATVTYEFYWDEQEGKYMEYGAEEISKSEFLKYSRGKEIWNKLKKDVTKKKLKTKYTILMRTNNTIDINMETTSKKGCYKTYTTLIVKDKKILTEKIVYHEGNKKCCKYPEIAKFK